MSKRNSREEKSRRREELAKKRAQFNDPCPQPEEYLKHFGFIPNEPYFQNAALAWNRPDLRFALRTKDQLIEYMNREETEWIGTRSGVPINYVSVFHTGDDKEILMRHSNCYTEENDFDYSTQKYYYILREVENFGVVIGGKRYSKKKWEKLNPFFYPLNTFCLSEEDIKNLPSVRTDHSEITKLTKLDEKYNALTEEELDNLIADYTETQLRKSYVFEEGGLVIDEFKTDEGETLYQPKKKEEVWKVVGSSIPFYLTKTGIAVGRPNTVSLKDT